MEKIYPWTTNDEGRLVRKFKLRTFAATYNGRVLKVMMPPYLTYSCDLGSEDRAKEAYEYIRKNGVDCSEKDLDKLLQNF